MSENGNAGPAGILPHHVRELRASGLSDATLSAAGIYSETKYDSLAALLNRRKLPKRMAPAIVFPFIDAEGRNGYCRLKPDHPRTINGKPVKYESPTGQPNQIYLPPGVAALLADASAELLITEGEKKSLKATQDGFPCIGLVGVYGWKDAKHERLLPALERIAWKGRPAFIVFDSDAADKLDVRDGEGRFAKHLIDRGATIRIVRLPAGTGADGKPCKMGLDDFLVAHGAGALRKLLAEAQPAEPVQGPQGKEMAAQLDAAAEASAMLVADAVGDLPRLRFWRSTWLRWNGASYEEVRPAEVRARVIRSLNTNYSHLSQRITGDVMDQLKAQAVLWGSVEPPAWIDEPAPWPADEVLATRNALVHLASLVRGEPCMLPPTPRFFTTVALNYDFQADAPQPDRWLTFLSEVWGDDQQSISTLQEWFGYFLTLDTSQQKMLMLIGPGRSGKGTIARVLRELIGPANVAGPALAAFAQNFGLSPLIGKALAIIHDARLGNRSDQGMIVERLLSITGEDAQTIDRKYKEAWMGTLTTRLMMLTNELPQLNDSSGALVGRMILLRTSKSFFGREDTKLTRKLLAELPGILLWSIEGWRRLRERGCFEQPATGTELLGDMADLASPVGAFVRERCLIGPGCRVAVADVYAAWRQWCELYGREQPGTEQSLGKDLLAAVTGLKRRQARDGDQRYRVYEGLALRN